MAKSQFSSPMDVPYALPNPDGDRRDIHDHNPSPGLQEAHDRGRGDPAMDFIEVPKDHNSQIGRTAEHVPDILSTPIGGQRRSATGEYESTPSIHRTQETDKRERDELASKPFVPSEYHEKGRE